ncbi:YitT family protein [Mycoplasma corogypsi]|uniref:YitT family protein n=1 Tax=Mycoplasma corogypsi TaxID=2106 RepID=UPI0038730DBA
MNNGVQKDHKDRLDKKLLKPSLNNKNVIERYKQWKWHKSISPKSLINDNTANKVAEAKTQNDDLIIEKQELEREAETLKYKMGVYLYNNKKTKLTFSILVHRYWKRVLLIFLSALLFNIGIQLFLSRGDTIPSGISGIPTILQYLFPILKPYFALIYLACNIPLFLIFARKSKKSFIYLTLLFMIFQIVINFVLTTDAIQEIFLRKIQLVPTKPFNVRNSLYTTNEDTGVGLENLNLFLKENFYHVQKTVLAEPNKFDLALNSPLYQAIKQGEITKIINTESLKTPYLEILRGHYYNLVAPIYSQEAVMYWYLDGKTWPILIYGCLGALFIGMGVAFSWKAGGSTGGTDIAAYYFSTKSKKSIANILTSVSLLSAIIFLTIYAFIRPNISHEYIGMREISTFLYIAVSNVVVNILYPKYKKMRMTIVSNDPQKIIAYFKVINYWHSYRIIRYKSGYTGKYAFQIETVVLLMEIRNLVNDLKVIDPKIWISVEPIYSVIGLFNTQYVE